MVILLSVAGYLISILLAARVLYNVGVSREFNHKETSQIIDIDERLDIAKQAGRLAALSAPLWPVLLPVMAVSYFIQRPSGTEKEVLRMKSEAAHQVRLELAEKEVRKQLQALGLSVPDDEVIKKIAQDTLEEKKHER